MHETIEPECGTNICGSCQSTAAGRHPGGIGNSIHHREVGDDPGRSDQPGLAHRLDDFPPQRAGVLDPSADNFDDELSLFVRALEATEG